MNEYAKKRAAKPRIVMSGMYNLLERSPRNICASITAAYDTIFGELQVCCRAHPRSKFNRSNGSSSADELAGSPGKPFGSPGNARLARHFDPLGRGTAFSRHGGGNP